MPNHPSRYELFLLFSMVGLLVWSGIEPHDRFTWILEVFPILIGVPVLIAMYPKFRFTPLVYTLIWVHAGILMLGGHYTYARVPLGFWMEDWLGFHRNHYDRLGHLAQGFIPAIVAREVFIRRSPLGNTLGAVHGGVLLPGVQRLLRADRVLDGPHHRIGSHRLPRHAGRSVGHAVGYDDGTDRGDPALVLLSRWHDRQIERVEAGGRSRREGSRAQRGVSILTVDKNSSCAETVDWCEPPEYEMALDRWPFHRAPTD